MSNALDRVKASLKRLGDSWKAKTLDGKVTVREFFDFTREGVGEAMATVAPLDADGKLKKELVLQWAGDLYDFFAPFIKSRFPWLAWFAWLVGEDLRDEFLTAVSLLIEVLYGDQFTFKRVV